jgi:hypothetical protein
MESKYHIITDLQCRVLHFGKEICIATPGEDACIELLKGRHLLSFVSTENPADSYKVEFKVPESEIEDFIEVALSPIRRQRIVDEKKAEEERQRLIRLEEIRKEEERRKKKEEEARRRAEDEMERERVKWQKRNDELHKRCTHMAKVFQEAKLFDETHQGQNELCLSKMGISAKGVFIYEGCKPQVITHLYGYIDAKGEVIIPFQYSNASRFYYERAFVKTGIPTDENIQIWIPSTSNDDEDYEIIETDHDNKRILVNLPILRKKILCIDERGNVCFEIVKRNNEKICKPGRFSQGLSIVEFTNHQDILCRICIIDRNGNILFERRDIETYNIRILPNFMLARSGTARFNHGIAILKDYWEDHYSLCMDLVCNIYKAF